MRDVTIFSVHYETVVVQICLWWAAIVSFNWWETLCKLYIGLWMWPNAITLFSQLQLRCIAQNKCCRCQYCTYLLSEKCCLFSYYWILFPVCLHPNWWGYITFDASYLPICTLPSVLNPPCVPWQSTASKIVSHTQRGTYCISTSYL